MRRRKSVQLLLRVQGSSYEISYLYFTLGAGEADTKGKEKEEKKKLRPTVLDGER